VLLICGLDCSAYLWQRDGFAEFSKQLRQTPSPAGPRARRRERGRRALAKSKEEVCGRCLKRAISR
jgi:hypothetical protein